MKHPSFDKTQFNCIADPLSAAKFMAKADAIDASLKVMEARRDVLQREETASPLMLYQTLLDIVQPFVDKAPDPTEALQRATVACQKSLVPHTSSLEVNSLHHSLGLTLLKQFGSFNVEAFKKAYEKLYEKELLVDVTKKFREAHKQVYQKERQRTEHWAEPQSLLSKVPRAFGEFHLGDRFTEKDMASVILRTFAKTWRYRAPLFRVPVSIYGTAIFTMDKDRKDTWLAAYEALELGKITKRPVFTELREVHTTALKPKQLSDVLAGVDEEKEIVIDG